MKKIILLLMALGSHETYAQTAGSDLVSTGFASVILKKLQDIGKESCLLNTPQPGKDYSKSNIPLRGISLMSEINFTNQFFNRGADGLDQNDDPENKNLKIYLQDGKKLDSYSAIDRNKPFCEIDNSMSSPYEFSPPGTGSLPYDKNGFTTFKTTQMNGVCGIDLDKEPVFAPFYPNHDFTTHFDFMCKEHEGFMMDMTCHKVIKNNEVPEELTLGQLTKILGPYAQIGNVKLNPSDFKDELVTKRTFRALTDGLMKKVKVTLKSTVKLSDDQKSKDAVGDCVQFFPSGTKV